VQRNHAADEHQAPADQPGRALPPANVLPIPHGSVLRLVTRRYGAFTQTRGRKPGAGVAAQKKFEGGGSFSRLAWASARAWAAEERRHRVAGQQPSLHDAKVVAQFRSTIWRPPNDNHHGPNPIARLRLCDCDAWNGPSGRTRD
jgi:hypothetical protein